MRHRTRHAARSGALKWKFEDGFHFAWTREGLWSIEQNRGRFLVMLDLRDVQGDARKQDMGSYKSLSFAKKVVASAHAALKKQE